VTEQFPDDVEAWMELSQILEQSDHQASLQAANTAAKLLKDTVYLDLPADMLNNIAALYDRSVR